MGRSVLSIMVVAVAALLAPAGCDSDTSGVLRMGGGPSSDMGVRPPSGFDSAVPAAGDAEVVEVRISNTDGSVSTVKLRKRGSSYVGPQGESYGELPTEAQLKNAYGF